MLPHTIILEPAQECVFASFIGAFYFGHMFGIQAIFPFLAFHFIYWAICDFILLCTLQVIFIFLNLYFFIFKEWIFVFFNTSIFNLLDSS
jgi:hypothetical protein